eukprot:54293-Pelagomonas_calceolata.AAC.3
MEAPAFPLPTGSFLCGQEQEQLQLMLQSRQPSSRLPSKSSSRSMPTLADLLCRKKPAPNRGLRGREEEEEEKEEEEEEEVEQEEQQLGLGNLVQVPPCANSARASRVAAADSGTRFVQAFHAACEQQLICTWPHQADVVRKMGDFPMLSLAQDCADTPCCIWARGHPRRNKKNQNVVCEMSNFPILTGAQGCRHSLLHVSKGSSVPGHMRFMW